MATAYKPPQAGGKGADEEAVRVHRIRITLTSKNVVNLEKGERGKQSVSAANSGLSGWCLRERASYQLGGGGEPAARMAAKAEQSMRE